MKRRYLSPDDPTKYVTHSHFKTMSVKDQTCFIVHWFHDQFWDPVHETPYISEEGGYLFTHGGPYDASDEIQSEFADIAKESAMKAAIEEVEADGIFEWAPSPSHPDQIQAREEYAEWARLTPASNPYEIFERSCGELMEMLSSHADRNSGSAQINRMIFSQTISSLEAYLADTLINNVVKNIKAIRNSVSKDKDLSSRKYSLMQIHENPHIIVSEVTDYLRLVNYHNLSKVSFLYKEALDIDIMSDSKSRDVLFTAISFRHDCVHRNGRDKNGNNIDVFTSEYIEQIIATAHAIVALIEIKIGKEMPF